MARSRPPARIAVLCHENARRDPAQLSYAIHHIARCWSDAGHDVTFVFGVKEFVAADLLIVHVDLSVVPDEYLAFARRYGTVLNGAVKDIRKSTFSQIRLQAGDAYGGQVIVKSDLNYGGFPERLLASGRIRAHVGNVLGSFNAIRTSNHYRVFDTLQQVPATYFDDPGVIVEKFLPEIDEDSYCLRVYHFLGDRATCVRIASRNPIVKAGESTRSTAIEPHPEILEWRRALKFDFGKFDYVVRDGAAVLLDVNKTPGEARTISPRARARFRLQAEGLYSFISDR